MTCCITTAIPYVNAEPHLGHALELVQADVLARHRRLRGHSVHLQTGTDDNALKNVTAAKAAGLPVREFVDRGAPGSPPWENRSASPSTTSSAPAQISGTAMESAGCGKPAPCEATSTCVITKAGTARAANSSTPTTSWSTEGVPNTASRPSR